MDARYAARQGWTIFEWLRQRAEQGLCAVPVSAPPTSATQLLYCAAGHTLSGGTGQCWLCGGTAYEAVTVAEWMKPTFNDAPSARGRAEDGVCVACVWATQFQSEELQRKVGKEKLQNFRTYSHFVAGGQWHALTKAQKREMTALLLDEHGLPEVAIVAESGQKHLTFKARTNPPGQSAGWILFEATHIWLEQAAFRALLDHIQALYNARYSKDAILSGSYKFYPDSDLALWRLHETAIKALRGQPTFTLAVYLAQLAQKEEEEDDSGRTLRPDCAGDAGSVDGNRPGLQEPIQKEHLDAIRGAAQICGEHHVQLALVSE